MKFLVGDIVRVRSWDDLVAEFGKDVQGNIPVPYTFVQNMRKYCGREFYIDRLEKDDAYGTTEVFSDDFPGCWHWSEEMFEHITTPVVVSDVQNLQDFL